VTTVVNEKVPRPGQYTVVVTVAPTAKNEIVNVSVGSQTQHGVPLSSQAGQSLAYFVTLKSKRYQVIAAASGARVHFSVAANSAAASVAAPTSGPYRKLIWSDNFSGPAGTAPNPAKWSTDVPGGGCGPGTLTTNTTSAANAALDGHGLAISATTSPSSTAKAGPYYSAQLDTVGHFSFTYGEVEARIEIPPGSGLCPAFWMLPVPPAGGSADSCPSYPCPEIDIMEEVSPYPTQAIGTLHGVAPAWDLNNQQFQGNVSTPHQLAGGFHTWGVIWSPNEITWTLDGLPYATATPATLVQGSPWQFNNTPFRIILDLAVGGWWGGTPSSLTGFPRTMRVDWVRVYQ
jgi:beta-glucanase (GH16 family)